MRIMNPPVGVPMQQAEALPLTGLLDQIPVSTLCLALYES